MAEPWNRLSASRRALPDVLSRESPGTVNAVTMNDQLRQGWVRKPVFWVAAVYRKATSDGR